MGARYGLKEILLEQPWCSNYLPFKMLFNIHSHFKFVLCNLGEKKRESDTSNTNWQFITRLNFMRLWISNRRTKFPFLLMWKNVNKQNFQLF